MSQEWQLKSRLAMLPPATRLPSSTFAWLMRGTTPSLTGLWPPPREQGRHRGPAVFPRRARPPNPRPAPRLGPRMWGPGKPRPEPLCSRERQPKWPALATPAPGAQAPGRGWRRRGSPRPWTTRPLPRRDSKISWPRGLAWLRAGPGLLTSWTRRTSCRRWGQLAARLVTLEPNCPGIACAMTTRLHEDERGADEPAGRLWMHKLDWAHKKTCHLRSLPV
mmetsp:Transcript_2147/g.6532  ORF Transcript_2147/g.6532 Transcript_2147/m.6532 type:complete len:220 (+) Transcript_2147:2602-3261(+)